MLPWDCVYQNSEIRLKRVYFSSSGMSKKENCQGKQPSAWTACESIFTWPGPLGAQGCANVTRMQLLRQPVVAVPSIYVSTTPGLNASERAARVHRRLEINCILKCPELQFQSASSNKVGCESTLTPLACSGRGRRRLFAQRASSFTAHSQNTAFRAPIVKCKCSSDMGSVQKVERVACYHPTDRPPSLFTGGHSKSNISNIRLPDNSFALLLAGSWRLIKAIE
ncbi:hypothetical protein IF1G_00916 [Cordyceps javanica]|uniref:Uncharacterized protein n=1 Tax=Cordyceps javanica TaxID=43265 RepID=A0A545VGZ1_9HYPO|nr:hypothetical protein IF1G_00916 [Cordyceps javanica]